jgi:hypothetical protein
MSLTESACVKCAELIDECSRLMTRVGALPPDNNGRVIAGCNLAVSRGLWLLPLLSSRFVSGLIDLRPDPKNQLSHPFVDNVRGQVGDAELRDDILEWYDKVLATCIGQLGGFRLHECARSVAVRGVSYDPSGNSYSLVRCQQCIASYDACARVTGNDCVANERQCLDLVGETCCRSEGSNVCRGDFINVLPPPPFALQSPPPPPPPPGAGTTDAMNWPLIIGVGSAAVVVVGFMLVFVLRNLTGDRADNCVRLLRAVGIARKPADGSRDEIAKKALDLAIANARARAAASGPAPEPSGEPAAV